VSSDNVKVNPSLNNNAINVATDDIKGVHFPIYKHAFGKNGFATLVSSENRLPVELPNEPKESNTVLLLNEISSKLDILIQYQIMLHKIDIT